MIKAYIYIIILPCVVRRSHAILGRIHSTLNLFENGVSTLLLENQKTYKYPSYLIPIFTSLHFTLLYFTTEYYTLFIFSLFYKPIKPSSVQIETLWSVFYSKYWSPLKLNQLHCKPIPKPQEFRLFLTSLIYLTRSGGHYRQYLSTYKTKPASQASIKQKFTTRTMV